MNATPTAIPDVVILEPRLFTDDRGWFYESYNAARLSELDIREGFVQDNHSRSRQNVLRGLHYQVEQPQGKLVRAVAGEIYDVAVDLRRSSPTFGKWVGHILSADNKRMLWVPPGFAHGFLTVSDTADVIYKTTDYYAAQHERCIAWNDPDLRIEWPTDAVPIVSEKDRLGRFFRDAEIYP